MHRLSHCSVIPLFHDQIRSGGPVTITTTDMTRFLLSLDDAVDVIFEAVKTANRGETYIPRVPAAKVTDIADILIGELLNLVAVLAMLILRNLMILFHFFEGFVPFPAHIADGNTRMLGIFVRDLG